MYARRDVLRAGATLGLLAASPWLHAAAPAGLLTRNVPSTGEALPVIGAGTSGSFEVQLRRMSGLEDGIIDGLYRFSRPLSGGYYWCPPISATGVDLSPLLQGR